MNLDLLTLPRVPDTTGDNRKQVADVRKKLTDGTIRPIDLSKMEKTYNKSLRIWTFKNGKQ